jgi:hypothetical protein
MNESFAFLLLSILASIWKVIYVYLQILWHLIEIYFFSYLNILMK